MENRKVKIMIVVTTIAVVIAICAVAANITIQNLQPEVDVTAEVYLEPGAIDYDELAVALIEAAFKKGKSKGVLPGKIDSKDIADIIKEKGINIIKTPDKNSEQSDGKVNVKVTGVKVKYFKGLEKEYIKD